MEQQQTGGIFLLLWKMLMGKWYKVIISWLGRGSEELFYFGCVIHAVGQFDGREIVEILVEKIEIVLFQILKVVLSFDAPQEGPKGMLGKRFRMFCVDSHCLLKCFFCVGGHLECCIEQFLRRFAVYSVPNVANGEVIFCEDVLRQWEAVVSERVWHSSQIFANSNLNIFDLTACPR